MRTRAPPSPAPSAPRRPASAPAGSSRRSPIPDAPPRPSAPQLPVLGFHLQSPGSKGSDRSRPPPSAATISPRGAAPASPLGPLRCPGTRWSVCSCPRAAPRLRGHRPGVAAAQAEVGGGRDILRAGGRTARALPSPPLPSPPASTHVPGHQNFPPLCICSRAQGGAGGRRGGAGGAGGRRAHRSLVSGLDAPLPLQAPPVSPAPGLPAEDQVPSRRKPTRVGSPGTLYPEEEGIAPPHPPGARGPILLGAPQLCREHSGGGTPHSLGSSAGPCSAE